MQPSQMRLIAYYELDIALNSSEHSFQDSFISRLLEQVYRDSLKYKERLFAMGEHRTFQKGYSTHKMQAGP